MPDNDDDGVCGEPNKTGGACKNPVVNDDGSCWIPSHGPDEAERPDPGRPTKLNPERQEAVASYLEQGYSAKVAAVKGGISEDCFYRWRRRGKAAADADEQGPFRDFYERTERAKAEGEKRWTQRAFESAIDNESFGACMEILRKRYPESWTSAAHEDDEGTRLRVMLSNEDAPDGAGKEYTMEPETDG
jgi:transposase-like protein